MLTGLNILVTRPAPQNKALCTAIAAEGGIPLACPAVEIHLTPKDDIALKQLKAADLLIFTSVNAVKGYIHWTQTDNTLKSGVQIAAIGPQTQQALEKSGLYTTITPCSSYNSEALLRVPELAQKQVQEKHIVIIKGENGRTLLRDTLHTRGARVDYANTYRRNRPNIDTISVNWPHELTCLDMITATSNEVLANLLAILDKEYHNTMFKKPLLVLSQRTQSYARTLGFQSEIIVALDPSNQTIIETIADWRQSPRPSR